jgi:hypothetical protein
MDEALISASCAQGCPVACAHVEAIEERVDVVERRLARVER